MMEYSLLAYPTIEEPENIFEDENLYSSPAWREAYANRHGQFVVILSEVKVARSKSVFSRSANCNY